MKTLTSHELYLIPRGYQSIAVDSEGVLSAFECRKCDLKAQCTIRALLWAMTMIRVIGKIQRETNKE